ncbi:MAG: thiamine diphosphokinase [Anaeroplasma bactoclasticum]|nr:thiamine diphosphokinase [Anaeroplasma bactoclasticum]
MEGTKAIVKIIIVANSPDKSFTNQYHFNPSDYFIGLDGGNMTLYQRQIRPDMALGDFDSTDRYKEIQSLAYQTQIYPKQKNETDLELALMHMASLQGARYLDIEVYDALGGRLDHEYVAYRLLAKYKDYRIHLLNEHNHIQYLQKGMCYTIPKAYQYFSIFADEASVVTIEHAAYPLEEVTLNKQDTYAVSNESLSNASQARVIIQSGGIFIFMYKSMGACIQ